MQCTRFALSVFLSIFGVFGYTVGSSHANPGDNAAADAYQADEYECFDDYDCYGDYHYDYEGYGDRAIAPAALTDDGPVEAPPVESDAVEEEAVAAEVEEDSIYEALDDGYPYDGSDPCEYDCPYEDWYGDEYDYLEASAPEADRLQSDMADLLEDARHSTGHDEALEINEQNQGLVERVEDASVEDADDAWHYDDCGYCGWSACGDDDDAVAAEADEEDPVAAPAEDDLDAEVASDVDDPGRTAEYSDEVDYDSHDYGSYDEYDEGYEYDAYGYDGNYGYDDGYDEGYDEGYDYNDEGERDGDNDAGDDSEDYDYDDGGYGYDEDSYEYDDDDYEYDEYGYDCDDYESQDYDQLYGNEYDTDENWQDEAADTEQTIAEGVMHGAIENTMRVMNQLGGMLAKISQQVGGIDLEAPTGGSELPQIDTPETADDDPAVEEDSLYWYSPDGDVGR